MQTPLEPGDLASIAVTAVAAVVVARLGRRTGWRTRHRVALAAGTLAAYAWVPLILTLDYHNDPANLVANSVLAAGALALCALASRRAEEYDTRLARV